MFDDWVGSMRVNVQAAAVQALHEGIRSGATETGFHLLGQLLAIDPTREVSYQLGMELHSAKWQYDRALHHYEACKAMLARELGVGPSPEAERIRLRILESVPAARGQVSTVNEVPASIRSRPKTVQLGEFLDLTHTAEFTAFMQALAEAVTIELAQLNEVVVLEPGSTGLEAAGLRPDFVLRASLICSGEDVLVMIRLSHGGSGRMLGGERFTFRRGDQLKLLPDFALSAALAVRFECLHDSWQLRDVLPVDPYPARLMLLKAHCRYYELTDRSLEEAISLSERALEIEPNSMRARRMLSLALSAAVIQGVRPREREIVSRAIDLARCASRAVPENVFCRCALAWALGLDGQHGAAVEELRHAIRLNPTYSTLHSDLAEHYAMLGYLSQALAEIDEAIRLTGDDVVSYWRYYTVAVAEFAAGNYAVALENARRVMRDKPGLIRGALFHAASAAALGLGDEAREALQVVRSERPQLRLSTLVPGFMTRFIQDRHHAQFLLHLEAAGLPS